MRFSSCSFRTPRPSRALAAVLTVLACFLLPAFGWAQGDAPQEPSEIQTPLRSFLEQAPKDLLVPVPGPRADDVRKATLRFYERHQWEPAWLDRWGPRPVVADFLDVLRQADLEGLDPADYRPDALARTLREVSGGSRAPIPEEERFGLDRALTRAFLLYGMDLSRGRVDPDDVDAEWHMTPRQVDVAAVLEGLLQDGRLDAAVEELAPPHPQYRALRDALARYRRLAREGGWPEVPEGATLAAGSPDYPGHDEAGRIRALEERLAAEGFLASASPEEPRPRQEAGGGEPEDALPPGHRRYTERHAEGVRRFQERRGILIDGILGPQTLRELNVPAEDRVRQIASNMERWRWLPGDLGERRIEVNVPEFRLRAFEGGRPAMTMKVVVGKEGWGTALFSDRMDRVVVNPYWNVPRSIAEDEILPEVRRDPGYLDRNHFEVLDGWGSDARTLSPWSVDWSSTTARDVRFRQVPGSWNALGRIKFLFPNRFSIYLHDTPADRLFEERDRAFSHGCVRVERPLDLADWVFQGDPEWNRSSVRRAIDSRERRRIDLPEAIPVWLVYWTAYVPEDGEVRFFQDIYGVDAALERALEGR